MSSADLFLSDGVASRPIKSAVVRIGRGEECELPLSDPSVSRHHCLLIQQEQSLVLRDLKSSNGTFVNGQRVSCVTLRVGDFIIVGNTGFVVEDKQHASLWERLNAFASAQSAAMSQFTTLANEGRASMETGAC